MQNLQTFNFESHDVRSLLINNEPWFVGKDVAEVLGYANASKAVLTHVENEDRFLKTLEAHSRNGNVVKTQTTLINESGLYSLIISSKLPSAKKFKRWVTSEVLPALRKTGSYSMKDSYTIEDPIERAKRWIEEEEGREAIKAVMKDIADDPKLELKKQFEAIELVEVLREIVKRS